jgi:hypothetical protein
LLREAACCKGSRSLERAPIRLLTLTLLAATARADGKTSSFDFELLPAPARPSLLDENARRELEARVRLRRGMLKWHQALGFVTLGLLLATDVLGTLNYDDKYGRGDDSGRFYDWHLGFSVAATASFTTTALLALFAPNPYPKPLEADLALLHKASMALATACFVAQLVLGPIAAHTEGTLAQRDLALAHVVVGWSAFGFMTVGTFAYVFK